MSVVFIGLSGPSSSGKINLAYLLRQVFPNVAYILHADDFCKEFKDIPQIDGYLDCDGPDSVDFVRMAEVLDHMKDNGGMPPPSFSSWQESVFPGQEEKALQTVVEGVTNAHRLKLQLSGLKITARRLVLVDGFLLYHHPSIRSRLHLRLFCEADWDRCKERGIIVRPGIDVPMRESLDWAVQLIAVYLNETIE